MGPIEIIVIVASCVFVCAVIGYSIYKKKTGKGGCDCGCSGCSACRSSCANEKEKLDQVRNSKKK